MSDPDYIRHVDIVKIQDRALLAFMSAGPAALEEKDYAAGILKQLNTTTKPDAPVRDAGQAVFAVPYDKEKNSLLFTHVNTESLHTEMNGTQIHRLMHNDLPELLKRYGISRHEVLPVIIPGRTEQGLPPEAVLVAGGEARKKLAIKALKILSNPEHAAAVLEIKQSEYRRQLEDKESPLQRMIAAVIHSGGFTRGAPELDRFITALGVNGGHTDFIITMRLAEKALPEGAEKDGPKTMLDHAQKGRGGTEPPAR